MIPVIPAESPQLGGLFRCDFNVPVPAALSTVGAVVVLVGSNDFGAGHRELAVAKPVVFCWREGNGEVAERGAKL